MDDKRPCNPNRLLARILKMGVQILSGPKVIQYNTKQILLTHP